MYRICARDAVVLIGWFHLKHLQHSRQVSRVNLPWSWFLVGVMGEQIAFLACFHMWHYLILIGVLWMFSEKQCCICQHCSILVSAGVFSLPRRFFPAEVTMN